MSEINYQAEAAGLTRYLGKCFIWVAAGLGVTALTAWLTLATGLYQVIFSSMIPFFIITIAELAVVIVFSARLSKMSVGAAYACFFGYSVLTGITFSMYGLLYQATAIYLAFGFTAVLFINMAIIGLAMKKDLSRFGSLFMAGLITLIVCTVINIFVKSSMFDLILCYVGIALFLGITAWDTQKIKNYYYSASGDAAMMEKANIYGALQLYLDFINLFIRILSLLGRNRRN